MMRKIVEYSLDYTNTLNENEKNLKSNYLSNESLINEKKDQYKSFYEKRNLPLQRSMDNLELFMNKRSNSNLRPNQNNSVSRFLKLNQNENSLQRLVQTP